MSAWTEFSKKKPKENKWLLVTNNLESRDANGMMSHLWLTSCIESDEYPGEIIAYDDTGAEIRALTHWRYAL